MRDHNQKEEESFFPSPLKLLYTAYSDERPVYSQVMESCFEKLEDLLTSLPEEDREQAFRVIYETYIENESQAFQAGVRTGVHLAKELL